MSFLFLCGVASRRSAPKSTTSTLYRSSNTESLRRRFCSLQTPCPPCPHLPSHRTCCLALPRASHFPGMRTALSFADVFAPCRVEVYSRHLNTLITVFSAGQASWWSPEPERVPSYEPQDIRSVLLLESPSKTPTNTLGQCTPNSIRALGVVGSGLIGRLSNQEENKYKLLFHNGSFQEKSINFYFIMVPFKKKV